MLDIIRPVIHSVEFEAYRTLYRSHRKFLNQLLFVVMIVEVVVGASRLATSATLLKSYSSINGDKSVLRSVTVMANFLRSSSSMSLYGSLSLVHTRILVKVRFLARVPRIQMFKGVCFIIIILVS